MSEILIIFFLAAIAGAGYSIGRLHQWIIEVESERPKNSKRLSHSLIAGLEDRQAIDTGMLLDIRDFLTLIEARLNDGMDVIGQIRNGEYDKDQMASPRQRDDRA